MTSTLKRNLNRPRAFNQRPLTAANKRHLKARRSRNSRKILNDSRKAKSDYMTIKDYMS